MKGDLGSLSKRPSLVDVFDLGDRLVCHPDLAKRFPWAAAKRPAKAIQASTSGVTFTDVTIVSLYDENQECDWVLRDNEVFNTLDEGEGWIFTRGAGTSVNTSKGIATNQLKRNLFVTRSQLIVVPESGDPIQAYLFIKGGLRK